jgi:hypothetical protein
MVIALAATRRDEGGDRSSWLTDRSLVPNPWERRSRVVDGSNTGAPMLGIAGTQATWAAIEGSWSATESSMRGTPRYLGWSTSFHSPSSTRSSCEHGTTISRTHRAESGSSKEAGPGTIASMGTDRRFLVPGSKLRSRLIEASKYELDTDRIKGDPHPKRRCRRLSRLRAQDRRAASFVGRERAARRGAAVGGPSMYLISAPMSGGRSPAISSLSTSSRPATIPSGFGCSNSSRRTTVTCRASREAWGRLECRSIRWLKRYGIDPKSYRQ